MARLALPWCAALPTWARAELQTMLDAFQHENGFPLLPHCVTLQVVGSRAHGTALDLPEVRTDVDLEGVVVAPFHHTVHLTPWAGWRWKGADMEITIHPLVGWLGMVAKSSPSALSLLWGPADCQLVQPARWWPRLQALRPAVTTRALFAPLIKYGESQLRRLRPFDATAQAALRAAEAVIVAAGWRVDAVVEQAGCPMPRPGTDPEALRVATETVRAMHGLYFPRQMGAKRRQLVEKFGYDTKMAAHTVRLARMAVEVLTTGTFAVRRTHDAAELRAIKAGAWSLEQVNATVTPLWEAARAATDTSQLPLAPNRAAIEATLQTITRDAWRMPPTAVA